MNYTETRNEIIESNNGSTLEDLYDDAYNQGVQDLAMRLTQDSQYKAKFEDISVDGHGLKWWILKAANML